MVEFKIVIGTKSGKSYQITLKSPQADSLIGKKIGDKVDGSLLGLPGYELLITGGTDRDGFPMRKDIEGVRRVAALLSGGVGLRTKGKGVKKKRKQKGYRERKTVRGNTIAEDIAQINMKVIKYGEKPIEELLKSSKG